jgi:hypothetical protein
MINNPRGKTFYSPAQMFAEEEEEEKQARARDEEELQMKESPENSGTKTYMPDDVQNKMENSFGVDFSDVDIHKDSQQAPSLGALAYTQGNDIHFAPGQYNPGSKEGQELLGHELSHVVQQREGRVKPTNKSKDFTINDNPVLEREADQKSKKIKTQNLQLKKAPPYLKPFVIQKKKKKKISSSAMKRVKLAEEAIDHTKNVFKYGAGNQAEALKKTKFNSYYRLKVMRDSSYWNIDKTVKPLATSNPDALTAAKADIARGGNCGEHASVAFNYLRVNAVGEKINKAKVKGLDHAFVLMGDTDTEKDDEIGVSDPWPTQATATIWEDHFAYNPDRSKLNIRNSVTGDGKNVKSVIAAGLSLSDSGKKSLKKDLNKKETKKIIKDDLGDWIWSHENSAAKGKNYDYYAELSGIINTQGAHFVKNPKRYVKNGKVIAKLDKETEVKVIKKGKSWIKVKILTGTHKGKKGWILKTMYTGN